MRLSASQYSEYRQAIKVQKYSSLGGGGNYLAKYKSVMHMDKGNSKTVKRMFSANQKITMDLHNTHFLSPQELTITFRTSTLNKKSKEN